MADDGGDDVEPGAAGADACGVEVRNGEGGGTCETIILHAETPIYHQLNGFLILKYEHITNLHLIATE